PGVDFLKRDSIAAIVRALLAKTQAAPRKNIAYNPGDFLDGVVMGGVADIKDLVVDHLTRRFESCADRPGDIKGVNKRTPGRSVTHHFNFPGRPGKASQIVEHDVKTHPG